MFKYGRIQKKIASQLVCGSCDTCLNLMLPRARVTNGLGFFLHSSCLFDNEDSDSFYTGPSRIYSVVCETELPKMSEYKY